MNLINTLKENKSMKLRIAMASLAALLIGSIFYIVSSFMPGDQTPLISIPNRVAVPTPTPIRSTMYTQPASVETIVGRRFDVTIVIDAKNTVINGVDSVISYDPTMLRIAQVTAPASQDKTLSLLRKQVENGKIYITAIKTVANDIPTQELPIAKLSIQALKSGTTILKFENKPGTTTASTIIQALGSVNILDKVTNATIVVK